jgi:hypothetical protein
MRIIRTRAIDMLGFFSKELLMSLMKTMESGTTLLQPEELQRTKKVYALLDITDGSTNNA